MDAVRLEFEVHASDLRRFHAFKLWRWRRSSVLLLAAVVVMFIAAGAYLASAGRGWHYLAIPLAVPFLLPFAPRQATRVHARQPGTLGRRVVELAPTGVTLDNGWVKAAWGWQAFTALHEHDGAAYLAMWPDDRDLSALVFPAAALEQAGRDRVRAMVEAHLHRPRAQQA